MHLEVVINFLETKIIILYVLLNDNKVVSVASNFDTNEVTTTLRWDRISRSFPPYGRSEQIRIYRNKKIVEGNDIRHHSFIFLTCL